MAPRRRFSRTLRLGNTIRPFGHEHHTGESRAVAAARDDVLAHEAHAAAPTGTSPASVFISVVLPAPLAPSSAVTPPARTPATVHGSPGGAVAGRRGPRSRASSLRHSCLRTTRPPKYTESTFSLRPISCGSPCAISRPWCSTTMRLHSSISARITCSITSSVNPREACSRRNVSQHLRHLDRRQSGHDLVEQQQARARGDRARHLEALLTGQRQRRRGPMRDVGEADLVEHLRARRDRRHVRSASRPCRTSRGAQVLQHRERRKGLHDLEGARDAHAADLVGSQSHQRLAGKADVAGRRACVAGDQAEQRRLAGAVGAHDADDAPASATSNETSRRAVSPPKRLPTAVDRQQRSSRRHLSAARRACRRSVRASTCPPDRRASRVRRRPESRRERSCTAAVRGPTASRRGSTGRSTPSSGPFELSPPPRTAIAITVIEIIGSNTCPTTK